MSIGTRLKQWKRRAWNRLFQSRLGRAPFSLVSNNCWGGFIYQRASRAYASPFVGLYLMPDCYLTLLENFNDLIDRPLTFVGQSRYPSAEEIRAASGFPVATLGDEVELHFMHSTSEREAADSWNRRLARLDRDRLWFKLCDRDGCTTEHIQRFAALPFPRKVCFVSRPVSGIECVVHVPGFEQAGELPVDLVDYVDKVFDTAWWLRTGEHRESSPTLRRAHRLLLGLQENKTSGSDVRS